MRVDNLAEDKSLVMDELLPLAPRKSNNLSIEIAKEGNICLSLNQTD